MIAKSPLSGLRVLDLSRVLAGPFVGQMLADFGADVIKVERPGAGDESRSQGVWSAPSKGLNHVDSTGFSAVNRGKRSIALDLAKAEGQDIVRRLSDRSDVVIENFKTGDLMRYGLDYEALSLRNPALVYCSITGFGQTGPYSRLPGYDLIFQAMSGVMAATGQPDDAPGGGPARVGYSVSDVTAGLYAVIGILTALHHRQRNGGRGQHIDIALLDTQIAAMTLVPSGYQVAGVVPPRVGVASAISCPYQAFACKDGMLVVTVNNEGQFQRLCEVLNMPAIAIDPRFATNSLRVHNKEALIPVLAQQFQTKTVARCQKLLSQVEVPCGPVNDIGQALDSMHVRERGLWREVAHPVKGRTPIVANPIQFSEAELQYALAPPMIGEHTNEVLSELLGMSATEIDALGLAGVTCVRR